MAEGRQLRQQAAAQETVEAADGGVGVVLDDGIHGVSRDGCGWSWKGLRFSHRRSAFQ